MTALQVNPDQSKTISVDASAYTGDGNLATTDTDVQKICDALNVLAAGDYPEDSMIVVPHGDTDLENGANLLAAYTAAKSLTPGGNALSEFNRAMILVPAGRYDLDSDYLPMDTDFIDIVGHGVCRLIGELYIDTAGVNVVFPETVISSNAEYIAYITADDFLFKSIHCDQQLPAAGHNGIRIETATGAPNGRFIDIGFTQPWVTGSAVYSTTYGLIASYFEEVHSDRAGTVGYPTYGGDVSGTFIRCSGPSIGQGYGTADVEFSGYAEDCRTENASYGFCSSGGQNGIFSGKAVRCKVNQGRSFGWGNVSGHYGVFSGIAIDCECTTEPGFGGATTPDVDCEFSGTAIRCKAGSDTYIGSFGGKGTVTADAVLKDCEATGDGSFGLYNFNGYGKRLVADGNSFPDGSGAAGSTGTLEDCRLTGRTQAISEWGGRMTRCSLESTMDGVSTWVEGAEFEYCQFKVGAASYSVTTVGVSGIKMSRCITNRDIHANITQLIDNGYNTLDADI